MNEDIIELPYEARLLFIGLWTLADREGRLENRPKKIKMSLFPADDINVAEQLENISKFGFIELYNADGIDVIHIVNFVKHQNPHGLEKDSELPDRNGIYTVYERNPKNKTIVGKPIQLNKADLKHFYDKTGPFAPQNTGSAVENSYQDNESNLLRECIIDGKNSFVHSYIINPDGGDVLIKSEMKFGLCQLTNYLCFLKLMNSISKNKSFLKILMLVE